MSTRQIIIDYFKRFILSILCSAGILTLFGYILDWIENIVNKQMYITFGHDSILYTAVIGTPLHEFAHWIGCKIFGFTVYDVELLRPVAYKMDGVLGYVSFSYNQDNWWHKLGCVFTGFAPMILGTVFILIIVRILLPDVFKNVKTRIELPRQGNVFAKTFAVWKDAFLCFWSGIFHQRKWGIFRALICLYLVISVSMHMTVSPADIQSASNGFSIVLIIYAIVSFISTMIGREYKSKFIKIAMSLTMIFSIGLMFDICLLGIGFVFRLII